jgi:hypothetical protein
MLMSKSIFLIGLLFCFSDASASAAIDQIGDQVVLQAEAAPNGRARAGFILIVIGSVLIAQYFVPMLPKLAALLILVSSAVVLLDVAFRLGVLYSALFVTIGLLLTLSLLRRKKKHQPTSAEKASPTARKAA